MKKKKKKEKKRHDNTIWDWEAQLRTQKMVNTMKDPIQTKD
jgi:hypothetical protein